MPSPAVIREFLAKYTPEVAAEAKDARKHLFDHFPQGFELVYDNYNALVFAFASSERASDAILSIAVYPKWVTLFFANGTSLPDPAKLLEGSGSKFRSIRLQPASRLHEPAVQNLIAAAKASVQAELGAADPLTTVIKSVSTKQRSRKPPAKVAPAKLATRAKAPRSGA